MNRTRVVVLLVALLVVGTLGLAAATVDAPEGGDAGVGTGNGTGSGIPQLDLPSITQRTDSLDFPWWVSLLVSVALVVSVAGGLYLLVTRMEYSGALVLMVVSLVVLVLVAAVAGSPGLAGSGNQSEQPEGSDSGEAGRPTDNPTPSADLPLALFGAFGVVSLLLVVLVVRLSGDDSVSAAVEGEDDGGEPDAQSVGEAAGRAADRIVADRDVENAVYRAWREMTGALDIDSPETTTPGEFADAAIEAGMRPDDVRELTWVFEEVRYGQAPVTDRRKRRAAKALRRIESGYADDGGDGDE